jgi:hypothetical protein
MCKVGSKHCIALENMRGYFIKNYGPFLPEKVPACLKADEFG